MAIFKSNPAAFDWEFDETDPDKPILKKYNSSEIIFENNNECGDRLAKLIIENKGLTTLDVSKATALVDLNCSNNKISSLTLPVTNTFRTLQCSNNEMTSLDVSGATDIVTLICENNDLSELDVTNLKELFF